MPQSVRGRGASFNTPNRFENLHFEPLEVDGAVEEDSPPQPTFFYRDTSKTILARNDSPDIPFTYSLNPYRGCEHGCIYCYARPSHEYLGFSAGLDFETKIMVKEDAPALLDAALREKRWEPQTVALSGNTDCYQPVERRLQLTRKCLEVFLQHRNPVSITTKNALVLRDTDLLGKLAELHLVRVLISISTLMPELARKMEPRTSTPAQRLHAVSVLAALNVPVGVIVAPVVPGLTDEEMPAIITAAAESGATAAAYTLLRLPGPVEPLFLEWLRREMPDRAARIANRVKETRSGKMSDARFGTRMTGQGTIADALRDLFHLHTQRLNLRHHWSELSTEHFIRDDRGQQELFDRH